MWRPACVGACILLVALAGVTLAQGVAGGIRGVVQDAEFGGVVPLAAVRLLEQQRQVRTGNDGYFLLDRVPAGQYTLVVSKSGYQRHVESAVVVVPGELTDVTVALRGEFAEMEEMIVQDLGVQDTGTEIGLLNLRSTSMSFQDSVSKDLMSKAGASDAASALKLVVGASVVGGKYATVRGLSDRYVGAAMNSMRVPSSDPKKRAVHLDVFPAGTIESISVSKTFTPNLPGDYTGGGVNIRTIGIPDEPFIKFSFSRGVNSSQTGKSGYTTYKGGGTGTWGRHGGARDMPTLAPRMEELALYDRPLSSFHTVPLSRENYHDERYVVYDRITRQMAPAMGVYFTKVPRDHSLGFSMGTVAELGSDWEWGGTAAFTYGRSFDAREYVENAVSTVDRDSGDVSALGASDVRIGEEELKWSMLGGVGLRRGEDHTITLNTMRNRVATDRASISVTQHDDYRTIPLGQGWGQKQGIHYTERSMDVWQLVGEHKWEELIDENIGLEIKWYGAHNQTEQEEPDVRGFKNLVYRDPDGLYSFRLEDPDTSGTSLEDVTSRVWRNTQENNTLYGFDVTVPIRYQVPDLHAQFMGLGNSDEVWSYERANFKFGANWDMTQREYTQTSFYYIYGAQEEPRPMNQPLEPNPRNFTTFQAYLDAVAQWELDVIAWETTPDGIAYNSALEAWDYDLNERKNPRVENPERFLWTSVFTDNDRVGVGNEYKNSIHWYILPRPRDIDYDGEQDFLAGYWMVELPLTKQFKIVGGGRLEVTDMSIEPFSDYLLFPGADPNRAFQVVEERQAGGVTFRSVQPRSKEEASVDISDATWLRSFGMVYTIMPGMNLRASYAQTLARPTFLEVAPVTTFDFIEGETFIGNQNLVLSKIENIDARWEWFRKPGEVWAISYFYKEIDDPIDRISFSYLGTDYFQAENYPDGRVQGTELEGRIKLDFPPGLPGELSLGANYTIIHATVAIPEEQANSLDFYYLGQERRPMEGQPEYLLNYNLTYDIESWGTSFGAFYNMQGDTLKAGAAVGSGAATPNIVTSARERLNLSLSQKIGAHAKLTFRIKNITNPAIKEVYKFPDEQAIELIKDDIPIKDDKTITRRDYRDGISYSFSLSFDW